MNYHRVFFPYVGLIFSVSYGLSRRLYYINKHQPKSRALFIPVMAGATALILFASAWATFQRNKVWRTDATLWQDVTQKSPANGRGWMNYGLTQMAKGDFKGAKQSFNRAVQLTPYYSLVYINMAICETAMNEPALAEASFQNGLRYDQNSADSHYYYAQFLCKQNRLDDAIRHFEQALSLAPSRMDNRIQLMQSYAEKADWEKLNKLAEETLTIDSTCLQAGFYLERSLKKEKPSFEQTNVLENPTAENWINLSLYYFRNGEYPQCIHACAQALNIRPNYSLALTICAQHILKCGIGPWRFDMEKRPWN